MDDEKSGGLIPASQVLPGLEDYIDLTPTVVEPDKPLTPQGRFHYTRLKQISALTAIGNESTQDMGFMARLLTLCSLPRTDQGDRLQFKRQNGPYKLIMIAGGDNKLPFGSLPRLLLAWVCTEAVRTRDKKLILGHSLAVFMQQLGIKGDSGGERGDRTRLRTQIDRLFNCHIDLIYEGREGKASRGGRLAPKTMLWWDYKRPAQDTLWASWIELGEEIFEEIIRHPMPINMAILRTLRRSPLGLDLYLWLAYKTFSLYSQGKKPERLAWAQLYRQFGIDPTLATDRSTVQNFRRDALRELAKLRLGWPSLDVRTTTGGLEVWPCPPSISPKEIARV